MKKQLVLSFLVTFCVGFLLAQNFSPSTMVSAGDFSDGENISLEWTLGETFIHTVNHTDGIITQGSQQPLLFVAPIRTRNDGEATYTDMSIEVYPNPVLEILYVDLAADQPEQLDITLIDLSGKQHLKMTANAEFDQLKLDMTSLTTGLYFLLFSNKDGVLLEAYKVIKNEK